LIPDSATKKGTRICSSKRGVTFFWEKKKGREEKKGGGGEASVYVAERNHLTSAAVDAEQIGKVVGPLQKKKEPRRFHAT